MEAENAKSSMDVEGPLHDSIFHESVHVQRSFGSHLKGPCQAICTMSTFNMQVL